MKWQPKVLSPVPDPFFVRELRKIDPDLRVVWGMERYLTEKWAIERKMTPERYFAAYSAILSDNGPRFVEQPIYDASQPIKDPETGDVIGFECVGTRQYDLAPEYEWVAFRETLDTELIAKIKKLYWEHEHPKEAAAETAEQDAEKAAGKKATRLAAGMDGVKEAFLETRKHVQFGYGNKRNEV